MSQSYLSKTFFNKPKDSKWWMGIILPVWVLGGFILAQVIVGLLLVILKTFGITFQNVNDSTFQTVVSAIIYLFSIAIVIGIPYVVKRYKTSKQDLGIDKPVAWTDLLLAPAGFIVYILLSFVLTAIASHILPFYNANQAQDTGFTGLSHGFEYILAFMTLVVIAPISEEILFRGYLLGKLRKHVPLWVSILITSALFGAIHLAWNVGVDVFALSIVLCVLRVQTGRLWPSMLLHMIKNAIAFYFLFINPLL
jgi:membrane protease YdiL (CAAX protease family)